MPTLGEITSIRGDAQIGAGTAGSAANLAQLPTDTFALSLINTAAGARMLANKYADEQRNKRLTDYLSNFNSMDISGIMEKDYETIIPEYVQLAKSLAANQDVIMNPFKDQTRYQELKGQEAALRGKIAESKQHLGLRNLQQTFISQHRDFQTPENIDRVQRFTALPMEERDLSDVATLLPRWDLMQEGISKIANQTALQKLKEQNDAKPFMDTTELMRYQKDAYGSAVRDLLRGQDAFGRMQLGAVENAFNSAPDYIKAQYRNADGTVNQQGLENFAVDQLYGNLRNADSMSVTKELNPVTKLNLELSADLARERERGRQNRLTLSHQKALSDEEVNTAASEIPTRHLSIFQTPDQAGAQTETIKLKGKDGSRPNWSVPGNYGTVGGNGGEVTAYPLSLDSWIKNAYAIPTGKRSEIDPVTRKVTETDEFMRPEQACVTGERDPNARKVIVRYMDKGKPVDLVVPFAENLQLLNNVAGPMNAIKLGSAKTKLLKDMFGKVSPTFEELNSVELFRSPNTGSNTISQERQGQLPTPPGAGIPAGAQSVLPNNPTTGGFILNATEYLKRKKAKQ